MKNKKQNNMKQTAVQYIEDNYSLGKTLGEMKIILATAKEMEKQQIVEAHLKGQNEDISFINEARKESEEYYSKTFKSE